MADGVACTLCGGNDFYIEAGHYYCNECQTQTQELHEHVFELPDGVQTLNKNKQVIRKQPKKSTNQITRWETYNYILLGLVNELIELGASKDLKPTVQVLWFRYLKSIGVVHDDVSKPPKLPAYNYKNEAEVIYGRMKPKKRKRSASGSSGGSLSTLDMSTMSKQKQAQLKNKMARAEYQLTQSSASESLHNISLGSLKDSSEEALQKSNYLQFTKSAKDELEKIMPKSHLKKHIKDVHCDMTCHKSVRTSLSTPYVESAEVFKRSRIYNILHLALLINKEKIQLGDMMRYFNEGHLSYNYISHFIPEDVKTNFSNLQEFAKNIALFQHRHIRMESLKVANLINLKKYLPEQDIVELCRRYCTELNLPESLQQYVINLIARTKPELPLTAYIPNYEARVISLIIFTLKLLLGLDGVTEYKFSNLAQALNKPSHPTFNFSQWLNHIVARKLVICQHHYPNNYASKTAETNNELYVNFLKDHIKMYEMSTDGNLEYEMLSKLLDKQNQQNTSNYKRYEFINSLTPFRDYLKVLIKTNCVEENGYPKELLLDFDNCNIDFLLEPCKYLNKSIPVSHGGANDNIELIPVFEPNPINNNRRNAYVQCELTDNPTMSPYNRPEKNTKRDTDSYLRVFNENYNKVFVRNLEVEMEGDGVVEMEDYGVVEGYDVHYKPNERFWLCSASTVHNITYEKLEKYLKTLPMSFRLILEECGRITSQTMKELLEEYNFVESYLCYNFNVKTEQGELKRLIDGPLGTLVRKSKEMW